jgi:hypothetical protein
VPLVILSKNYDFAVSNEPLQPSPQASGSAQKASFPEFVDTTIPTAPVITVPEKDETFTDSQPMFKGKALPETNVIITIQSQPLNATVKADNFGNCEYRPETPLEPGQHTLTINAPDSEGLIQTLTQPFTVYAQGSQFVDPTAGRSSR